MGRIEELIEKLEKYIKENPNLLTNEEKRKLRLEFMNCVVKSLKVNQLSISSLLVEFFVYAGALPSKEDKFLEYIKTNYPRDRFPRVLEVSSGKVCSLAQKLKQNGYKVTAMDPDIRIRPSDPKVKGIKILKRKFTSDFSREGYDVILGHDACPAAGTLLRIKDKPVVFTICDRPETDELDLGIEIKSKQEFIEELSRRNAHIQKINSLIVIDNSRILEINNIHKEQDDAR